MFTNYFVGWHAYFALVQDRDDLVFCEGVAIHVDFSHQLVQRENPHRNRNLWSKGQNG